MKLSNLTSYQYNYSNYDEQTGKYKLQTKKREWLVTFDFLYSLEKVCLQPIHLCVDVLNQDYLVSFGFLFVRFTFRIEGYELNQREKDLQELWA